MISLLLLVAMAGEPECTLSGENLTPKIGDGLALIKGKVKRMRKKQELIETAELKTGAKLIVSQGGCEHFGLT